MSDKREPRTPAEVLEALEDEAEADRILGLSDEELDKELAAEGVDPEAVRERGKAFAEKLMQQHAPGEPEKVRPLRRRGSARGSAMVWISGAALAAASVAAVISTQPPPPRPPAAGAPADAVGLRRRAADDCAAGRWSACLEDLNRAEELDPDGAKDPGVVRLKREASERVGHGGHP
jgi:hypothetical protein